MMKSEAETPLTPEQKCAHVEAYMKSNLTRREYCDRQGLKFSSFKNWTTRYGQKPTSDFVPVIPTPQRQMIKPPTSENPQCIEIIKGDCKIILSNITNVPMVLEIIKGAMTCS